MNSSQLDQHFPWWTLERWESREEGQMGQLLHFRWGDRWNKEVEGSSCCSATGSAASFQHQDTGLSPAPALWVKDSALPQQLRLGSNPWVGNSICWNADRKGKREKKKSVEEIFLLIFKHCFLKSNLSSMGGEIFVNFSFKSIYLKIRMNSL